MSGKEDKLLFNQIFGDNPPNQEDLHPGDPLRNLAEQTVPVFDSCVDYLREKFPNRKINDLIRLFWRLVGNKVTPTAITPAVEPISFWAEVRGRKKAGYILIPENWLKLVDDDLYMQLGGIVHAASHAKDYYEAHVVRPPIGPGMIESLPRALAYEAEYLHTLGRIVPDFTPNQYQSMVMSNFPNGVTE